MKFAYIVLESIGHDAVIAVSDWRTMVAPENAGCVGGSDTGAQDAAVTFQLSVTTGGPDCVGGGGSFAVGAVGDVDFEQPIASTNKSPQSVRVTKPPHVAGARDDDE